MCVTSSSIPIATGTFSLRRRSGAVCKSKLYNYQFIFSSLFIKRGNVNNSQYFQTARHSTPACRQAGSRFTTHDYSVRNDFTGLATAALIAWKLTVINAINTTNIPAPANIHQLKVMRYG